MWLSKIIPKKLVYSFFSGREKRKEKDADLEPQIDERNYLAKNDFLNELLLLKAKMHKNILPLPKPRKFYERYPNLKTCNGDNYTSTIDTYIEKISEEVEKINSKTSGVNCNIINNMMDGLEHYIKEYPKKK